LEVVPSGAPEPPHSQGDARAYCLANARVKAEEVAGRLPGRFVLGADTEVILDGMALGKPSNRDHAASILESLSDRTHEVMTGFCLIAPDGRRIEQGVYTQVRFKPLTDIEIQGYLDTGEPMDKAGAYGIQGIGTFLVASINGSYSNVVGLPMAEVLQALKSLGGPAPFG